MVNILDKEQMQNAFGKLKPDAKPLFGKMSPQHVVEHLARVLAASSGKFNVKLYLTPEEAEALKKKLIYSDAQLPMGIKNPTMGDEPPALRHKNMDDAFKEFYSELEHFADRHKKTPDAIAMHPRMGELKCSEWLTFHNKHFLHHFKQYALV